MTLSSWARIVAAVLASMLAVACGEQKVEPRVSATPSLDRAPPEAIPERVDADLVIVIRDIVQLPATNKGAPLARINALVPAGDGSPRLFAVDMDGAIHVIERDQLLPAPFLDMTKVRGKAFVHDAAEKGLTTVAFHPDFARTGAPGFGRVYTASTESAGSGVADFGSRRIPAGGVAPRCDRRMARRCRRTPIASIPLRGARCCASRIRCPTTRSGRSRSTPMRRPATPITGCST